MKFFLTDDVPAFTAALREAGHEVEIAPVAECCDLEDWDNPKDYPLGVLVKGAKPDVFVLVNPVRWLENGEQFAFFTGHVRTARKVRGALGVMLVTNDPWTWDAYRSSQVRTCGARPRNVSLYISVDRPSVLQAAKKGRAAWWDGSNVERVVEAIEHAKRGTGYSPRRDAENWA